VDLKCCDVAIAEITLKFNISRSNSQNFPRASLQISHINKTHKIKSAQKDYLDMSVFLKAPHLKFALGPMNSLGRLLFEPSLGSGMAVRFSSSSMMTSRKM